MIFLVLGAALLGATLSAQAQVGGEADWVVGVPAPTWVEAAPLPNLEGPLDSAQWGDVRTVLLDEQIRTSRATEEVFHHHARQVITTTGMSDASTLRIKFDPSYTRLEIHQITIHRNGAPIDALDPSALKLIHQEEALDYQIYDGSLQAVALLSDVRVGDTVEWSWTLKGRNPALSGHYADWWALGWSMPVARARLRILSAGGRPLQFKYFQTELRPKQSQRDGGTEYLWDQEDVPAVVFEDSVPSWWMTQPVVQIADFESWGEVARWAAQRYDPLVLPRDRMPDELGAAVAEWSLLPSEERKAEAALRFVQDEVRYLGIEIGESGYIPHDPAEVYARRFGDCKDKALLLASILRAMGMEAHVALLDTDWKEHVADLLPSPYAFDHAIVAAKVDGREVWMDATRTLQRGDLQARRPPGFGRALIVAEDTEFLSSIPASSLMAPQQEILEEFVLQEDGSALLTVTTTTRGESADGSRQSLSGSAIADTTRSYLNFYTSYYPGLETVNEIALQDDEVNNVMTVTESYRLPALWVDGQQSLYGWSIDSALNRPSAKTRLSPVGVTHPVWIRHAIRVKGIGRLTLASPGSKVEDSALRVDFVAKSDSSGVDLYWDLRSLSDHVNPEDVEKHIKTLDEIESMTGYLITSGAASEFSYLWLLLFPVTGAIGTAVAIGLQRRSERPKFALRAGESPNTAIPGTPATALARFRCTCGGTTSQTDSDPSVVRYAEKELLAVETRCHQCGSEHTLYVG